MYIIVLAIIGIAGIRFSLTILTLALSFLLTKTPLGRRCMKDSSKSQEEINAQLNLLSLLIIGASLVTLIIAWEQISSIYKNTINSPLTESRHIKFLIIWILFGILSSILFWWKARQISTETKPAINQILISIMRAYPFAFFLTPALTMQLFGHALAPASMLIFAPLFNYSNNLSGNYYDYCFIDPWRDVSAGIPILAFTWALATWAWYSKKYKQPTAKAY